MTPTGCRPRTFHPTVDTTIPNINNNFTPKPGLCIHKDGSKVLLGFPNQLAPKLSHDSHILEQSKYPTLFYLAWTTRENEPPPFSAMQSPRKSFSLFFLQCNWSKISMMELSRLTTVRNTRHRPMHLRDIGLKSQLDQTSDHYNPPYRG
jgi:hypothetical protein